MKLSKSHRHMVAGLALLAGVGLSAMQVRAGFEFIAPAPTAQQAPLAADPQMEGGLTPMMPAMPQKPVVVMAGDNSQEETLPPVVQEVSPEPVTIQRPRPPADLRPQKTAQIPENAEPKPQPVTGLHSLFKQNTQKQASVQWNDAPAAQQGHDSAKAPMAITPQAQKQEVENQQVAAKQPSTGYDAYAPAIGFGADLPLITAVQQIVPSDYTFVFDQSVPVASRINWEGGRPWPEVLRMVTDPLGLDFKITGKLVSIGYPTVSQAQPVAQEQNSTPEQVEVSMDMMGAAAVPQSLVPLPYEQDFAAIGVEEYNIAQGGLDEVANMSAHDNVSNWEQAKSFSYAPEDSNVDAGQQWFATKGSSLRTILEAWSDLEGVELQWQSDYDYVLVGDLTVTGNFEHAVEYLLKGFQNAKPNPVAKYHPNLPSGPKILIIAANKTI